MKKIVLFLLLALIPLAFVTPPPAEDAEARRALEELMEHWQAAVRGRDIDAFMEAYWPEAEKVILQPDKPIEKGSEALEAIQSLGPDEGLLHILVGRAVKRFRQEG